MCAVYTRINAPQQAIFARDGGFGDMTVLCWLEAMVATSPTVVYFRGTQARGLEIPFSRYHTSFGVRVLMASPAGRIAAADAGCFVAGVARVVLGDLDALGVDDFWALGWSGAESTRWLARLKHQRSSGGALCIVAPMDSPDAGLRCLSARV